MSGTCAVSQIREYHDIVLLAKQTADMCDFSLKHRRIGNEAIPMKNPICPKYGHVGFLKYVIHLCLLSDRFRMHWPII